MVILGHPPAGAGKKTDGGVSSVHGHPVRASEGGGNRDNSEDDIGKTVVNAGNGALIG